MQTKFVPSSKQTPCFVCGREKDGDCRTMEDGNVVLCHSNVQAKQGDRLGEYVYLRESKDGLWGVWVFQKEGKNGKVSGRKPIRTQKRERYYYRDRQGENLVAVDRVPNGEGKDFYQHHWDGSQWVAGMPDHIREQVPVYRYQDVRKAIFEKRPVFMVEGEAKCDRLWDLGIAATTTLGGSKKYRNYGKHYKTDLEGADLVLCPDRDKVGVEHMEDISRDFPNAKWCKVYPRSVVWGLLPDNHGLDVGDWIDQGATQEEILGAIESKQISHEPKLDAEGLRSAVRGLGELSDPFEKTLAESAITKQFKISGQKVQRLLDYEQSDREKSKISAISDVTLTLFEEIELRSQTGVIPGITCGFYDLDAMTQGFQRGDLVIIAARPSMGKTAFAVNLLTNIAEFHKVPTLMFSLEMGKERVANRIVSSYSRISVGYLRSGRVAQNEWEPLGHAIARVSSLPIFIDDSVRPSVDDIRQKAIEVREEHGGVNAIVVDYIQLMDGDGTEYRVQELAKISRGLKAVARELDCPVFALSQLSRGVEGRDNKRPMMSDLRECLTRSALLTLADTGERKSIADIQPGMIVLAVDRQQKVVPAKVSQVWSKGIKPVHRLTTKTGRQIECTDNHPILTQRGYVQLKDLKPSDLIATALRMECPDSCGEDPRKARLLGYLIGNGCLIHGISFCTPCTDVKDDFCELVDQFFPGASFNIENKTGNCWEVDVAYHHIGEHGKPFGNPLRNWARDLGLTGKRSPDKFAPEWVFKLGAKGISEFLAGLLYTDGSVKQSKSNRFDWSIVFDTSSQILAADILQLLTRLGIAAHLARPSAKKKAHHHAMHRISLSEDSDNLIQFACMVEKIGYKGCYLNILIEALIEKDKDLSGKSVFALPKEISSTLNQKSLTLRRQGVKREPGSLGVWRNQGKRLNRSICDLYAKHLQDEDLEMWANSDLLWEEVRSVEYIGEEETFDVCVPETGNFLANGIAVHNSGAIEQDADLILMLYRDEYYKPETPDRGIAEVIVVKHRDGPTGTVKLLFEPQFSQFRNLQRRD